jgi:hypothetical protein
MLRPDTRPNRRNAPRPAWKVNLAYLQWLRGRRCAFESRGGCSGRIEAAHTPDPQSKAMGDKAADRNAIPACQWHHKLQTDKGWSAVGLTRESAQALAQGYWRAWPGDKGELG